MKFLRDIAHCKYESYTKEEIDTKLNEKIDATEVYKKGNFAVIEYNLPLEKIGESNTQWEGTDIISFPEGFTKENTCIIGMMCKEIRESEPISAFHTPYSWIVSDGSETYEKTQLSVALENLFGKTDEEKTKILIYGGYYGGYVTAIDIKLILMKVE